MTHEEGGGRRRRRARGKNHGNERSGTLLNKARFEDERGREAEEGRESGVNSGERRAIRGFPQEAPLTPHKSKLAWALQWLPDNNVCYLLSLQKQVMQRAQQSWYSMWQASAKSRFPSTLIEAPPDRDVLALHQLL